MSPRGLLILALLLAVAVVAVVRFERPAGDAAEDAASPPLLELVPSDVTGVEIVGPSETISLARLSGGWWLGGAFPGEADPRQVESLLEALVDARVAKTIEERTEDLSRFGLAPAQRRVRVSIAGGPEPIEVLLGRSSPVASQAYVSPGGGRVVLVDGSFGTAIGRSTESFREMRVIPVEQGRIRRIEIAGPELRVVLERRAGEWWIEAPFADRADFDVGERIARAVGSLRFDTVTAAPSGAPGPVRRISVRTGEDGPGLAAEIALGPKEGFRLARRLPDGVHGRVSTGEAQEFEGDPEGLREKRLATFPSSDVREVAWTTQGAAWTARRESEGAAWTLRTAAEKEREVETGKVEAVMDAARRLRSGSARPSQAPLAGSTRIRIGGTGGLIVEIAFVSIPSGETLAESTWRPGITGSLVAGTWRAFVESAGAMTP